MNSSLARSRPGVRSRIISARCAVWRGGSKAGSWSLNGSMSRWRSMMSVTSSPSKGSGNFTNGPLTALHDENCAESLDRQRLVVARDHEDAVVGLLPNRRLRPHRIEVGVGVEIGRAHV